MQNIESILDGKDLKKIRSLEPKRKIYSLYDKLLIFIILGGFFSGLFLVIPFIDVVWGVGCTFGSLFIYIILTGLNLGEKGKLKINIQLLQLFVQKTFKESSFTLYGKIPADIFQQSNLVGSYTDMYGGYHIKGILNNRPVNIGRLHPRRRDRDNYYEGVLIYGTFDNPFPHDVYFHHTPPMTGKRMLQMDKSYTGKYSTKGGRLNVYKNLSVMILNEVTEGYWGERVKTINNKNYQIHIYSPKAPLTRKYITDKIEQQFNSLAALFPDCDMMLSCRGDSFYLAVNFVKLIHSDIPGNLTQKETLNKVSENYRNIISAANILTTLHQ